MGVSGELESLASQLQPLGVRFLNLQNTLLQTTHLILDTVLLMQEIIIVDNSATITFEDTIKLRLGGVQRLLEALRDPPLIHIRFVLILVKNVECPRQVFRLDGDTFQLALNNFFDNIYVERLRYFTCLFRDTATFAIIEDILPDTFLLDGLLLRRGNNPVAVFTLDDARVSVLVYLHPRLSALAENDLSPIKLFKRNHALMLALILLSFIFEPSSIEDIREDAIDTRAR